jgi:hypothetical protein
MTDFNDTWTEARMMLSEAARTDPLTGNSWLSEKTIEVSTLILLYNGELGVSYMHACSTYACAQSSPFSVGVKPE